jgi:DNA modification methylase
MRSLLAGITTRRSLLAFKHKACRHSQCTWIKKKKLFKKMTFSHSLLGPFMIVEERYDLGSLVTFVPNKRLPIHNWFYFKEGFSRDFVGLMIDEFGLQSGSWVLDPFCGVGTTLLTARERGINSVGVDISPLFTFVSQVKLEDYDPKELRRASSDLFAWHFSKPDLRGADPFVRRAFSKYTLEDILFFRGKLDDLRDRRIRDFLTLALMSAAMKSSYAIKDGAVLKIYKRPVPPFRKFYKRVIHRMIRQLEEMDVRQSQAMVRIGDARRLEFLDDESIEAIITSPPYLNKIEYTTVYSIEYSLFLGSISVDPVRSYIGLDVRNVEGILPDLPVIAQAYFADMKLSLREMHRVLRQGGKIALVVAGGVFRDCIVESDLLLAGLAEDIGLEVERILAVNKRVATIGRAKIGEARESIMILRK